MKKQHALGFVSFLLAIGSLPALATTAYYTIDFNVNPGSVPDVAPSSGSFDYDSSTDTFTNFLVTWNSITYDLTAAANSPAVLGPYGAPACIGGATGGAAGFLLMTACQTAPNLAWTEGYCCSYNGILPAGSFGFEAGGNFQPSIGIIAAGTPSANSAFGQFAIAPEPGTIALLSLGLCWMMRKNIATRLRHPRHD